MAFAETKTQDIVTYIREEDYSRVIEDLSIDAGNRWVKYQTIEGEIKVIPAYIRSLGKDEQIPFHKDPIIQYEGDRYTVGTTAKDLNGTPLWQEDKTALALKMVLACIEPVDQDERIVIEKLKVLAPDSEDSSIQKNLNKIKGTHEFIRDDFRLIVEIQNVQIVNECEPAYLYALREGWFKNEKPLNAVFDFGGGDLTARLYTRQGKYLENSRIKLPGTKQLANEILNRIELGATGYTPTQTEIMDALHEGRNTTSKGLDIKKAKKEPLANWLNELMSQMKRNWSQHQHDIGQYMFIGGSANLMRKTCERTKGLYFVPNEDPQTLSLHALTQGVM